MYSTVQYALYSKEDEDSGKMSKTEIIQGYKDRKTEGLANIC